MLNASRLDLYANGLGGDGRGACKVAMICLCVAALIWGMFPRPVQSELVDRIIAIVNDDIILDSDMAQVLAPMREQLKQSGYSETQQDRALAEQRPYLIEQLITEKLTDQQVKRFNVQVSDAEVDATIARLKELNNLSDDLFHRKLELDGLSYGDFKTQIKQKLLRTKLVNLQISSRIVITEEDARAYYEKSRDKYAGQTRYHLRRIMVNKTTASAAGDPQNPRERINRVYERLRAGESFIQLAAAYSEDRSAADGGDLGVFEARLLAQNIRSELEGLQKGQFSGVIDTEQGYQILYLEDVIHSGGKSFETAKAEIQEQLYAEIVDQRFTSWLKTLRDQAHVQILE